MNIKKEKQLRGKRKTLRERNKIKKIKLEKENTRITNIKNKELLEKNILNKKNEKEKQKYIIHKIKKIENIVKKRNRKKKNKIPNPVLINLINKDSINIYDNSYKTLTIYGKAVYIIYFILKEKRNTFSSLKNLKIKTKIYNKSTTLNYINIPIIEKNYIINILKKLNINYYIISKRLGYFVLEKELFEDNKFRKIYKLAKKETKKEKTIKEINNKIKYMKIDLIKELIQIIKKYDKKYKNNIK